MEMSFFIASAITLVLGILLVKLLQRGPLNKNVPRGSLGLPLIGETFSFLQAMMKNQFLEWINERAKKYGPAFKTSIVGDPTVVIAGHAGNKYILSSSEDVFVGKLPSPVVAIAGKDNLFHLTGSRYKLIRGAMMTFMRLESLQNNMKRIDDLVVSKFLKATKDKDTIPTEKFMKRLTFDIACHCLFDIEEETLKQALFDDFMIAFGAFWSIPLNLPGMTYWRGIRARNRINARIVPLINKRREELSAGIRNPTSDVIANLLSLKNEHEEVITEELILDNYGTLMIAGHAASAILMTLMVWKMSRDPEIYQKVFEEQMEISEEREARESKNLTWADIQKMKYTWRVAQELMRVIPPSFGSLKQAVKDTSYGGYTIPKGWQVLWTQYNTHMDPNIFENPHEFNPSRFESNSSKPIPPYAFVPFGAGLHACIGNEFARVEVLITIHRLLTMFEWSLVHSDEVITRLPTPYPSKGLPIKVKPRKV